MTRLIWSNDDPTSPRSTTEETQPGEPSPPDLAGLSCHALRAGQGAPHFRLPDQYGCPVMLRSLLAGGPVVLRFCGHDGASSCFSELDTLAALGVDIEQRGATLAVIAAEPAPLRPADANPSAEGISLLIDAGAKVARSYGLTYRLPPAHRAVAAEGGRVGGSRQSRGYGSAPATFVIDQKSVVAIAFVDLAGRSRVEPDQILMALECLGKRKTHTI